MSGSVNILARQARLAQPAQPVKGARKVRCATNFWLHPLSYHDWLASCMSCASCMELSPCRLVWLVRMEARREPYKRQTVKSAADEMLQQNFLW